MNEIKEEWEWKCAVFVNMMYALTRAENSMEANLLPAICRSLLCQVLLTPVFQPHVFVLFPFTHALVLRMQSL